MSQQQSGTIFEEFKVTGSQLLEKIEQLVHEGNVRRIHIRQGGRTVLELPVTVVAVGVVIAPLAAALGAFAAIATDCTIAVEREPEPPAPEKAVEREPEPPAPEQ